MIGEASGSKSAKIEEIRTHKKRKLAETNAISVDGRLA
jgi:hypothetical protein